MGKDSKYRVLTLYCSFGTLDYTERTVQFAKNSTSLNHHLLIHLENLPMIQLHGHEVSGNCYKVSLLLSLLQIDYTWVKVDLMNGEQKSPEFLALNPFAQVPVLVDGDTVLSDAQAILVYLARQYGDEQWLPSDALPLAQVIRWLSTTAGEVRQGPETARLYHLFGEIDINIGQATQASEFILKQLNDHLATRDWLELGHITIADIAVFPYVALAGDGKIALEQYPNVLTWVDRVKHLPNFVGMMGVEAPTAAYTNSI